MACSPSAAAAHSRAGHSPSGAPPDQTAPPRVPTSQPNQVYIYRPTKRPICVILNSLDTNNESLILSSGARNSTCALCGAPILNLWADSVTCYWEDAGRLVRAVRLCSHLWLQVSIAVNPFAWSLYLRRWWHVHIEFKQRALLLHKLQILAFSQIQLLFNFLILWLLYITSKLHALNHQYKEHRFWQIIWKIQAKIKSAHE